jgi:YesN/AraC family two-component response regulator
MVYKIVKRTQYELLEAIDCAHSFPMHIHKRLCVGLVNRGEKYITIGVQTTKYAKGDMFVIPPFTAHACGAAAQTNYSVFSICADKNIDRAALLSDLEQTNFDADRIIELVDRAHEFMRKIDDLISNLIRYIDKQIASQLSIEQIAHKIGYDSHYASRLFKKAIGISPHRYIIQERIKISKRRAKEDLLSEIALASGFYDQSYFIRHFKKYEGVTPKVYYQSLC